MKWWKIAASVVPLAIEERSCIPRAFNFSVTLLDESTLDGEWSSAHAREIAKVDPNQIAAPYFQVSKYLYYYGKTKMRTDPLYLAVASELVDGNLPLLDIGTGAGFFPFYLRAAGFKHDILGVDYDEGKIQAANQVARAFSTSPPRFRHSDAREGLPEHLGEVTILDVLQFCNPEQQRELLTEAAARVAPGGRLIIRSGLRDEGWRFKITKWGDWFAKGTFWMRDAPVYYPTRDTLMAILGPLGFEMKAKPLWGKTPFNNWLLVFTRQN